MTELATSLHKPEVDVELLSNRALLEKYVNLQKENKLLMEQVIIANKVGPASVDILEGYWKTQREVRDKTIALVRKWHDEWQSRMMVILDDACAVLQALKIEGDAFLEKGGVLDRERFNEHVELHVMKRELKEMRRCFVGVNLSALSGAEEELRKAVVVLKEDTRYQFNEPHGVALEAENV